MDFPVAPPGKVGGEFYLCCAEKKSFAVPNAGNGNGAFLEGRGEKFFRVLLCSQDTQQRFGYGAAEREEEEEKGEILIVRSLDGWKRQNVCSQVAAKEAAAGGEEEDGFGSVG